MLHNPRSHPLRSPFRTTVPTAACEQRGAKPAARAWASGLTALSLAALLSGCGGLTAEETAKVTEETRSGLRIVRRVATVLDFLHLLPKDACGDPKQHFATTLLPNLEASVGCALLSRTAEDEQDVVRVDFPAEGCSHRGRTLTGTLVFAFNAGEDRTDLSLDFNELLIDGRAIPARGGYGTCGDAQSYWADVAGTLPQSGERHYVAGGTFMQVAGLPIIGGEQASLDAAGLMTTDKGASRLKVSGLVLMLFKQPIPRSGVLEIELSDGRHIYAHVQNEQLDENLIHVEVQLDDKEPVRLKVGL